MRNSANSGPGELIEIPGGTRRAMIGVVGVCSRDIVESGRMQSWVVDKGVEGGAAA